MTTTSTAVTEILSRKPPQNLEAERCVLGAILIDNDAVGIVSEIIRPEDVYDLDNRCIYEVVLALYEENRAVDAVVVKDRLEADGRLEGMGGVEALVAIMESVPSAANVADYAEIVRDRSQKRRLIAIANKVIEDAYGAQGEAKDLVEYVESEVFRIAENRGGNEPAEMKQVLLSTVQMIEEYSRNKGKMTGCGTDFHQLDNLTNGLQPGDLIILAARPSVGKTTFAINCAMNMAVRHDKAVAFFSLEMAKEQIAANMLCAQSEVRASHVRKGNISETEWAQLLDGAGRLNDRKIFIDDTPGLSPTALRGKARRLKRRSKIDAIFIDYLQLMEAPGAENRQQQISTISRSLKLLARELKVPIIALSQINRASEKEERKPRMSDLRESGAIEQDADIIMFLHDANYQKSDGAEFAPSDGRELELIIAKHRNGSTGTVELKFVNEMMLFRNPPSRY
ncbi:MAG: replicative DNA helicase [Planctomycetota bacterium]